MARTSDDIILDRAQQDLEEGIDHALARIRASHPNPFVWRPMEGAVLAAIKAIRLRAQYRDDVTFLLSLAHRCADGEDPAKLADENLAKVLRLREMSLVVREKDPAFQPVLDKAKATFALRLPDLARMVRVEAPADYSDIVRKAFPDRKYLEDVIAANRAYTLDLIAHFEAHPQLLRVPSSWIPRFGAISREIIEWQTDKILRALDEIYA